MCSFLLTHPSQHEMVMMYNTGFIIVLHKVNRNRGQNWSINKRVFYFQFGTRVNLVVEGTIDGCRHYRPSTSTSQISRATWEWGGTLRNDWARRHYSQNRWQAVTRQTQRGRQSPLPLVQTSRREDLLIDYYHSPLSHFQSMTKNSDSSRLSHL